MIIVTGKEMQRIENLSFTQEGHHLASIYMEKAGKNIALHILKYLSCFESRKKRKAKILLLCAKGNNSGDAFVCGRHLLQSGYKVDSLCIEPIELMSTLCHENYLKFISCGGKHIEFSKRRINGYDIIIDGLLGTGFKGKLEKQYLKIISLINTLDKYIFSIDIPSGMNANTEKEERSYIIKACETLTLGLAKVGMFFFDNPNYLGKLQIIDFGLKKKFLDQADSMFKLLCFTDLPSTFIHNKLNQHKYEAGSVLALAGSSGMCGAAYLTTKAAYKTGSGIVKLICNENMLQELSNLPELVKIPIISANTTKKTIQHITKLCDKSTACIIGPGLGSSKQIENIVKKVLPLIKIPSVIDADGISICAKHNIKPNHKHILTPHHGELQKLLHITEKLTISSNLLMNLWQYCKDHKTIIVLKGYPSFIVSPNLPIYISLNGNPGMATAGSGDVLSGIIGSLLSKGLTTLEAATLGTWLHGSAGNLAAKKFGIESILASDILDHIYLAIKTYKEKHPLNTQK